VIISTGGALPDGVLACGGHAAVRVVPEPLKVRNPVLVASTNGYLVGLLITYVRNTLGSKGL
jgi:hypothetical protein